MVEVPSDINCPISPDNSSDVSERNQDVPEHIGGSKLETEDDEKVTEEQCKNRWTVLRNKFNVERRNVELVGLGSDGTSKWDLFTQMQFLNVHIKERQTKGNIKRKFIQTVPIDLLSPSSSTSVWDNMSDDQEVATQE
ncbi:hypothetical protein RN001_006720 [Aquatica leii]|uniref:MADF domain-containing protein n=1 Tax=Aquatica leii TaxID=1421715 RepID=A0AAN7PLF4_9COLE|nr:hypothetical protein RN001_006720 [Aquatica leii]